MVSPRRPGIPRIHHFHQFLEFSLGENYNFHIFSSENCFFVFLQMRVFTSKSSHLDPFWVIFRCLQIFSKKTGLKSQIDHSSVFSSYLHEKTGPGDLQNDVFFDDFWHLPARRLLKVARVSQRATNRTPKVDQLVTRWLLKVARVSQRASNRTPKVDQPLTKLCKKCSGSSLSRSVDQPH